LAASAPDASIGDGVRIRMSGSTTSSIVFEMSSVSPVLTASMKRLNVALLAVLRLLTFGSSSGHRNVG
jgi:hypothetical protein